MDKSADSMDIFDHIDALQSLNDECSLNEKVGYIHRVVQERFQFIHRIAIAVYDSKREMVKTFVASGDGEDPLRHYEARLSDAPSLREIIHSARPRVVNDLDIFASGRHEHTLRMSTQGFGSSYTMPMYLNGGLFGFVFFNSREKHRFTADVLHYLDLFGHLLSLLIVSEISSIHTLLAAVKTAREMTHQRDPETGAHLDRMSRYARLIARELSPHYGFTDEYIEHVFLFAPLHDIGKIGIPDRILLKPGKLSTDEYELMKTHAEKGREIIDRMLANFGLEGFQHIEILRNIANFHHEAIDGSGYPRGLKGEDIPMEARIVAVSDVFDALTSRRPYKHSWCNADAYALLRRLSGTLLDKQCVDALIGNRAEVEKIQASFAEDQYG